MQCTEYPTEPLYFSLYRLHRFAIGIPSRLLRTLKYWHLPFCLLTQPCLTQLLKLSLFKTLRSKLYLLRERIKKRCLLSFTFASQLQSKTKRPNIVSAEHLHRGKHKIVLLRIGRRTEMRGAERSPSQIRYAEAS